MYMCHVPRSRICTALLIDGLAAGHERADAALQSYALHSRSACFSTLKGHLFPLLQPVEGIVLDVGWYRTTIRSFEREIFAIPNSVFSRNVVLNVTRKGREWRIFEFIGALSLCLLCSMSLHGWIHHLGQQYSR
jgi:Mechanosensitive ion channel